MQQENEVGTGPQSLGVTRKVHSAGSVFKIYQYFSLPLLISFAPGLKGLEIQGKRLGPIIKGPPCGGRCSNPKALKTFLKKKSFM